MENQDILKLLCNTNSYTQVNVCVYQTWESYRTWDCLNNPKKNDLLLFLNHCNVTYRMKNGEVFSAGHGDIIYVPSGKEYTLTIDDRDELRGCTYGINFLVFDESYKRIYLKNNQIISYSDTKFIRDLFIKMSVISEAGSRSYAQLQALFYQIIVALSENVKTKDINNYMIIEQGIRYLETDPSLEKSVAEIAKMCNVSQNYFCRLFKEYSGITPQDYILKAKIEKAKIALRETSLSVSEIALLCGFEDASYFCRLFKKKTGVSPLGYKKSTDII